MRTLAKTCMMIAVVAMLALTTVGLIRLGAKINPLASALLGSIPFISLLITLIAAPRSMK